VAGGKGRPATETAFHERAVTAAAAQRARNARSQNAQSAAPPAMVPSRYGLISMIFFTVPLAMYGPCVERESTDTMTPPARGGRDQGTARARGVKSSARAQERPRSGGAARGGEQPGRSSPPSPANLNASVVVPLAKRMALRCSPSASPE
jgi:hypothetical protein